MAFFAYLDAGGDASQPALSAAGYVARGEQWTRFDSEWEAVLASEGVNALHMKQFAHFNDEFASWKGHPERRASFLARLRDVIGAHTMQGISTTLFVSAYHTLNTHATVRERLGGPYTLTMLCSVMAVKNWHEANAPGEPMTVFLERGDKDQGELLDVLRRFGYPYPVTALDKKSIVNGQQRYVRAFEAADFLAYEFQKGAHTMREKGADTIQARKSLLALVPPGPSDYLRVIDVHALAAFGRSFGVRRRSGGAAS
jgi:hypothetical protein